MSLFGLIHRGSKVEVPLERVQVKINVLNLSSQTNIRFEFWNKDEFQPIEAVFRFKLEPDTVISELTAQFDSGMKIIGICKEKVEAQNTYDDKIASGGRAALLSQNHFDQQCLSIGNLDPQQKVEVSITYLKEFNLDSSNCLKIRLPITRLFELKSIPYQIQIDLDAVNWEIQNIISESQHPIQITSSSPSTSQILCSSSSSSSPPSSYYSYSSFSPFEVSITFNNHNLSFDSIYETTQTSQVVVSSKAPNEVLEDALMLSFVPNSTTFKNSGFKNSSSSSSSLSKSYLLLPQYEFVFLVDESGSMSGRCEVGS